MKELRLFPEQIISSAIELLGYRRLRISFRDYRDRGIGAIAPVLVVDGKRKEAVGIIKKEFETALVSPFPLIIQRDKMVYLSPSAKSEIQHVVNYAGILLYQRKLVSGFFHLIDRKRIVRLLISFPIEKINSIKEPFYLLDGIDRAMAGCLYCRNIPAIELESDDDVLSVRRAGSGIKTPRLLVRRKTLEEVTKVFEDEMLMANVGNNSFHGIRTVAELVEGLVESGDIPDYMARYYLHKRGVKETNV